VYWDNGIDVEGKGADDTADAPELSQDMEVLEGDVRLTGGGGGRVPGAVACAWGGRGGKDRTAGGMTGGGGGRGRVPSVAAPLPFVCNGRVGLEERVAGILAEGGGGGAGGNGTLATR
jgi:hypothetical protein